jgi:hypothetical protein
MLLVSETNSLLIINRDKISDKYITWNQQSAQENEAMNITKSRLDPRYLLYN